MGKEDRDWYRNPKGKHPPSCNCADCTKRRLGKSGGSGCLTVCLTFIAVAVAVGLISYCLFG